MDVKDYSTGRCLNNIFQISTRWHTNTVTQIKCHYFKLKGINNPFYLPFKREKNCVQEQIKILWDDHKNHGFLSRRCRGRGAFGNHSRWPWQNISGLILAQHFPGRFSGSPGICLFLFQDALNSQLFHK